MSSMDADLNEDDLYRELQAPWLCYTAWVRKRQSGERESGSTLSSICNPSPFYPACIRINVNDKNFTFLLAPSERLVLKDGGINIPDDARLTSECRVRVPARVEIAGRILILAPPLRHRLNESAPRAALNK